MARRDDHDFRYCLDPDCPRFLCRLWKEAQGIGYFKGFLDGEEAGKASGFAEGFASGFSAGVSSAPVGR